MTSINPYQNMEMLEARGPQELINLIKQIDTPIKITQITNDSRGRWYAFITGDVRVKRIEKIQKAKTITKKD